MEKQSLKTKGSAPRVQYKVLDPITYHVQSKDEPKQRAAWSMTFFVGQEGRFLGDVHTHGVELKFELVKSALARRTRGTFSSSLS